MFILCTLIVLAAARMEHSVRSGAMPAKLNLTYIWRVHTFAPRFKGNGIRNSPDVTSVRHSNIVIWKAGKGSGGLSLWSVLPVKTIQRRAPPSGLHTFTLIRFQL